MLSRRSRKKPEGNPGGGAGRPGRLRRVALIALVVVGALVLAVVAVLSTMSLLTRAEPATGEFRGFSGPGFLVASDADMTATAYATGALERVEGIEDALSVVRFPEGGTEPEVAELNVSNSVLGWPSIVEVSPDGSTAYVVEPRGTPPPDVESYDDIFAELPAGSLMSVVDISDPSEPEILQEVQLATNPSAVSVNPDGDSIAVGFGGLENNYVSEDDSDSLAILPVEGSSVGEPAYFDVDNAEGQLADVLEVEWHPSGDFLALTADNTEVAFFEVSQSGAEPQIEPFGERFAEGTSFTEGTFSPDGDHFIIEDVMWGEGATGFLFNGRGTLTSIRFDEAGGEHEIVSTARVGVSPEGLAMSPDGSLIATVNMRRTYLQDTLPVFPARARSSVSLVEFDSVSGELTTADEYFYEGLLPEDAVFDAEGESLAVTIYNYAGEFPEEGVMEFWNVTEEGGGPALERTDFTLPVVRGPHTVEALR